MRLRTWLPPGAARGLGRRLLLTVALAPPTAWLSQAVLPGTAGYGTALTRSLAISLCTWAAVDLGRFLLRGPLGAAPPHYWPPPRGAALLLGLGLPAGVLAGIALGDMLAGPSTVAGGAGAIAVFGLAVAGAMTAAFYSRGRQEALARQVEAARLAALKAQLDPHMLFNTLATLRALIATDPPRATAMLDRLVGFLRATLGASRAETHSLAAERAWIEDYLALMQIRLGARLTARWDIPTALEPVQVPALLLQPAVENAIRHGIEPKPEGGRIEISARREGGELLLRVRDTGVGLPAAAQDRFGLVQLRERLRLLHGSAASVTLAAAGDAEGGALVTLRLPMALPVAPSAP